LATEWSERIRAVTGETWADRESGAGVRALIVARKRRNGRGAKGGRKVEA
jgi:hypothetical protein